jgi:hypothetical protein
VKSTRFHPAAAAELDAQANYYEDRSAGLGDRFPTIFMSDIAKASQGSIQIAGGKVTVLHQAGSNLKANDK